MKTLSDWKKILAITITLFDDNKTISVEDTGRGMRIADKHESGKWMYDVYFLTLFAGSKYASLKNENRNTVTSGANGVGATTLNYTSEYFKVESFYDGKHYSITFSDSGKIVEPLKLIGDTTKHGTKITFRLDPTAYTKPTTYDSNILIDIISKVSGCSKGVKFLFNYTTIKCNLSTYYNK